MGYLLRGGILVALILALPGNWACAQEVDKKPATPEKAKKPYFVKVKSGHHEEKFDVHTKKGRTELAELIEEEGIDKIEEDQGLMSLSADTAVWTLVVFVALIVILKKFAWGPMLEGLTKREQTIRQSIDEAQLAREETERLRAKFKLEMDQAFAQIPQLMEEARKKADKLAEEKLAKATADIQAERDRLRREMQIQLDQALQTLWDSTAELATQISGRVLGRTLTPDDHQRLFQVAADELQASGQHDEFVKA